MQRHSLTRFDMPSTINATNWFATQVRPNGAKIAARNLQRQGFPVFAPLLEHTQQRRGKFVSILQPLFNGYVFVQFDPNTAAWRSINGTYGVSRVVSFGIENRPIMVPPALIAELNLRCDENGIFHDAPALKPGDQVRITKGPFAKFAATVTRLSKQERVWVLLDMMGAQTSLRLPRVELEAA
jgi:transcriptional antiterminator RfaH